jgi:hypothetical protein
MPLTPVTGFRCLGCGQQQPGSGPARLDCCEQPFLLRVMLDVPEGEPLIPGSSASPADAEVSA